MENDLTKSKEIMNGVIRNTAHFRDNVCANVANTIDELHYLRDCLDFLEEDRVLKYKDLSLVFGEYEIRLYVNCVIVFSFAYGTNKPENVHLKIRFTLYNEKYVKYVYENYEKALNGWIKETSKRVIKEYYDNAGKTSKRGS